MSGDPAARWPGREVCHLLDEAPCLPSEAIAAFQRDGHVLLRGLIDPGEMAMLAPAILAAVAARVDEEHALQGDVKARERGWRFVANLWRSDAMARRLALSYRLAATAAQLLGVPRLRMLWDQAYCKDPGGEGTSWHQDAMFTPLDTTEMATAWVALSTVGPDSSPMRYASGSHRGGLRGTSGTDAASMNAMEARLRQQGLPIIVCDNMVPGDVTFQHGMTAHATMPHRATTGRDALVVHYAPAEARLRHDDPADPLMLAYP